MSRPVIPERISVATIVDRAWQDVRRTWFGPLRNRTAFGIGYTAGYRAALAHEPLRVQLDVDELAALGAVVLTPDDLDVVAPALLEAGERHLEKPGTAWQALGGHLHAIAVRLYAATERQEQP